MLRRWARSIACRAAIAYAACNDPDPQRPLGADEVDAMTHLLLVEAALQDFSGMQRDTLARRYYDQLYDRFGLSLQELNSLRDRFSDDPTLWQRTADSLVARFDAGRGDIDTLLNLGVKSTGLLPDTLRATNTLQ